VQKSLGVVTKYCDIEAFYARLHFSPAPPRYDDVQNDTFEVPCICNR
jgi:hypothetical protein